MDNETKYPYRDEQGAILYTKVRHEPGLGGRSKSFHCERIDAEGNTIKNLENCRKILYRLPLLSNGIYNNKVIFLVEGEKDADNLIKRQLTATTTITSQEWHDDYTATLKAADVVILYDNDRTGLKRRDLLCAQLAGQVKRLRVVDLPGLDYTESHGADISDWLQTGHTTEELLELVANTPDYTANVPTDNLLQPNKIKTISLNDFLTLELPPREMLLAPLLPTQGILLLYAKRGVGKTHVALHIAYAVAGGGTFLKWQAPAPKRVLYIDGEMPAILMQERLQQMPDSIPKPMENYLHFITPDLQEGALPNLSTQEGRDQIEKLAEGFDLIIIDNLSTLFRSGSENEAESWFPAQDWALQLRRKGKSVIFVHHAGKGGQQRGTSKKEDAVDVVLCLKQPEDYQPEQGARFEVHFEKARHLHGDDATPFVVELGQEVDGTWKWNISGMAIDEEVQEIATLMNKGMTIAAMAQQTGLSKSQVETKMKHARRLNLTNK